MKYNPNIHHRRSIRLKGYDYSQPGAYFITICTHQKECIFGEIIDEQMQLNHFGKIVQFHWCSLEKYYSHIQLDEFVVMPNHFHGIIIINENIGIDEAINNKKTGIPEIIRGFKTFSARQINKSRHQPGMPLWQRNYYERIIRDEEELNQIKKYIINNPQTWTQDQESNNT
ncbi:transposase [Chlorogloeopsis sp. ULAP02]|uniref:transposase n=1 Tax=Chlorogloeopsis sp. ULAP02 TaxID=3107926 RepID=UPI0031363CC1